MIKAIIFDYGGVITLGKFEDIYDKLAEYLKINPEDFIKIRDKYLRRMFIGKISTERFCEIVKKEFNLDCDVLEYYKKAYLEVISKNINQDMLKLIKKLKNNYKLILLSNILKLHADMNEKEGIFSDFDELIFSYNVGFVKPDQRIYNLALKRINLRPEECIFIDDYKDNIKIAYELGIRTILYKNEEDLIKNLNGLGVKC